MAKKVVLAGACRTAIGKMGGALSNTPAAELGSIVIKEALNRAGVKPEQVDEVLMGCVIQAAQGQNVARQASIKAGLPIEVPAVTLNVVCGSGLKCVNEAATMILAGQADIVVAGGMENMSMAPYAMTKARFGYRMNNATIIDTMVNDALTDAFNHYHMMITAENVCEKYGLTREELDEFSANSQQKCEKAIAEGKFDDEIVPVPVKVKKETVMFAKDEGPRPGTTAESLSKLKCCSGKEGGLVTAGNASGINDGAAAIVVMSEEKAKELAVRVADTGTKIVSGMEGLLEIAVMEGYEILVTAVVGMIGIRPTMAAIEAGKDIALANKETLVTAGHLIIPLVKEKKVRLLPVDSEHSAIFQCLNGEHGNKIEKILLTASGGPFRGWTREQMKSVQVEDALKHPNWTMGRKITIDSSTMVNKGLEVMEARWLFGVEMDQVQVVVQPQSVIHSMVEYEDGAVIAQLGTPDMKLPIQYALYYPERRFLAGDRLDFAKLAQITFEAPDFENFHGLSLAYKAGRRGGTLPTVFNAANERAVQKFLDREIGYLTITDMIEAAMEHHTVKENPTVEEILAAEQETYDFIESRW